MGIAIREMNSREAVLVVCLRVVPIRPFSALALQTGFIPKAGSNFQ